MRAAVDEAMSRDLAILGETSPPGHIRIFLVGSRLDMKSIVGATYGGYADAAAFGAVLVAQEGYRPATRHEIMHLYSLRAWGYPGTNAWSDPQPSMDTWRLGSWLREGIAAAAEDSCGDYRYRAISAQMQTEGKLFAFDTLRHAFLTKDDLATYLQSGSLVQYLLETYGTPRFRELWRDAGRNLERVYGVSETKIEADWRKWLEATTDARPSSVALVYEKGCSPPKP
jgi:hypothetical protein